MSEPTDQETIASLRQQVLDLESKLHELKRQIRFKDEVLREKNLSLDAYHHVWCSGSCKSGIHRYHDMSLTEEIVIAAELNTRRLRTKFDELAFQSAWSKVSDEEKSQIFHDCNVAKTRKWQDVVCEVEERYKEPMVQDRRQVALIEGGK